MATFDTIEEIFDLTTTDELIVRQGTEDFTQAISDVISSIRPVGTTYETVSNNFDPNGTVGFPGTWVATTETATISAQSTSYATLGVVEGSDTVSAPLLRHSHGVSVGQSGAHSHTGVVGGEIVYEKIYNDSNTDGTHAQAPSSYEFSYEGAHTHPITVDSAGETSPTIDVSGRRYTVVVWTRTA